MKVVGIMHKVGTFTDKQTNAPVNYDNWELHCICNSVENPSGFTEGSAVSVFKIKAVDYATSCNAAQIKSPVGLEITPLIQLSGHYIKYTGFTVIGKAH